MMFYGTSVKPGTTVKLQREAGEVLHISGASLVNPTNNERVHLIFKQNDQSHVLCVLRKDFIENVSFDLYIATRNGGQFEVQGSSEVSIVGYYELTPHGSNDDDTDSLNDDLLEGSDAEESTNVSEDEDTSKLHKLKSKHAQVEEIEDEDEKQDSDDDDDDEDEADQDNDEDDDDDEDDGDDEDDEKEIRQVLKQQTTQKKGPQADSRKKKNQKTSFIETSDVGKKRKAETQITKGKPDKQQKGVASQVAIQQFEKSITQYLKKHGRSLISQLASTCPKPVEITTKYKEFLISRPSFQVEGQHISLKA